MKTKPISEERIAQIINDIAEDVGNYTKAELVQVVNYLQDEFCKLSNNYANEHADMLIAHLDCVQKISKIAGKHNKRLAKYA